MHNLLAQADINIHGQHCCGLPYVPALFADISLDIETVRLGMGLSLVTLGHFSKTTRSSKCRRHRFGEATPLTTTISADRGAGSRFLELPAEM